MNENFKPVEQSQLVKDFLHTNPESGMEDRLKFLLDNFPQKEDDQNVYLIEGGTAMALLHPESKKEGADIDIVTISEEIKGTFANAEIVDVKTIREWLEIRGIKYSQEAQNLLMSSFQPVKIGGREVIVMSPEMLAVSKQLPYLGREPREKDKKDLEILGVSSEQVEKIISKLKNN